MSVTRRSFVGPLAGLAFVFATLHCGDDAATNDANGSTVTDGGSDASTPSTGDDGGVSTTDGGTDTTTPPAECASEAAGVAQAVCAANAFLATLSDTQKAAANLAYTDKAARTNWSNLPGVTRAGVKMGDLSADQQTAALAMMATVLTSNGLAELTGIRAADDYLAAQGGGGGGGPGGGGPGGGGGGGYGSANYYVAVVGTPSTTDKWEIMFGGHHMAFNVNYVAGVGYPVPNHAGVEPKGEFTQDGTTYAPLEPKASALVAIFKALDSTSFSSAYLTGQTFSDVLIGPQEYGTGSYAAAQAKFPTGSARGGVVVSTLPAETQALVTTAIELWVRDYAPETATSLLADYTSADAYADTRVAWAGTSSTTLDVDVDKTYMRIDGPRVWIEVSCQAGVVIQGKTHYHTIYRDKSFDYGDQLQ